MLLLGRPGRGNLLGCARSAHGTPQAYGQQTRQRGRDMLVPEPPYVPNLVSLSHVTGSGKTSLLRDITRFLADELLLSVVVVDTSCEIGGMCMAHMRHATRTRAELAAGRPKRVCAARLPITAGGNATPHPCIGSARRVMVGSCTQHMDL